MLDDDLVTVFVNSSMATMLGYTVDEMRGRCLSDFVSKTAWTDKRESLRRPGAEHGERAQGEYRRKDGSVLSADVSRTRAFSEDGTFTGVLKIVTDTTNQRRVEEERQDALDRLVLLSKAIEQTADGVLISDSAGHIEYVNPAFERTTGYTREEAVCYTQGVIDESNVIEPDHNLWSRILAHQPYSGTLASRNRTGDPYWAHLTITPITDRTGLATHSVAVLTDVTDARKYHEQEVRLRLARAVQQRFNPSPPLLPGFDIAAASVLADETGGDYCDFVELPSGVLYVAIGDVSGHGFDAALVMALTRAYTRSFATLGLDVGEVLARTNRALIGDLEGNRFVTMLLVRIDAVQRLVTYAGAGHLPAILLDDSGNIETAMESTGLPLGLFADAVFASRDIRFTTRETLVLSTDGITETSNSDGLEFGRHGLIEFVRSHAAETAEEIAAGILGAARSFGGAEPQLDDATCVIVKVTDPAWGIEDPAASVKHAVALAESAGSLA
jgi:sigma-B regulation protein RsbU (phosphoserine phosphatase)